MTKVSLFFSKCSDLEENLTLVKKDTSVDSDIKGKFPVIHFFSNEAGERNWVLPW